MEKEMATHSSILAWRIPWMEEPGGLQSTGSQRVRHDWSTSLSLYIGFPSGSSGKAPACQCRRHKKLGFDSWIRKIPWRGAWQPTLEFLPGKSHGRRSLVGYSPWGRKESDTTERLHFHALEQEMATCSSILAWRIPGTGASWAAVYGVAQSQTQLMWLSSNSSSIWLISTGVP